MKIIKLFLFILLLLLIVIVINYYYGKQFRECTSCKKNEVLFIDVITLSFSEYFTTCHSKKWFSIKS